MDIEKTYFKTEFKINTSVGVSYEHLVYLQKLNKNSHMKNTTMLKRIIVEVAIEITNDKKVDKTTWEKSISISNRHVVMLKINEPIKRLIDQVVSAYFLSTSHFVRYAILKVYYQNFDIPDIKNAKVVSLGKLF